MNSAIALLLALATVVASGGHFRYLQLVPLDGDESAVQCLLSDADQACTPPLAEFKGNIHGIASTNCAQCTVQERELVTQYFAGLFTRNPTAAMLIQDKYDPTGEIRLRLGEHWRRKGVPIYPLCHPPLHAISV